VNPEEVLRLRVQALVARGLSAPEVSRRAGLAAASEVWGGDVPRDRAAWYLWLRDRTGAFQLELAGAERLEGHDAAVLGRLTIRHYPATDDPLLAAFDPDERAAAAEWLDRTGTPRIDVAGRIPEHLFAVGALDWVIDPERDASLLVLSSQDRLRTVEGGRVRREVPGWRLAAPVFSALAALHAQLDRRAASRLVVTRQRGFEVVRGGEALLTRDADEIVHGEALLAFTSADGCGDPAARLLAAVRDPAAETVRDERLAPGGRRRDAPPSDARLPLEVSPAWFGGEAHVEGIACAC
jgi:hypothetical protein